MSPKPSERQLYNGALQVVEQIRPKPNDVVLSYGEASWFEPTFDPALVRINGGSRLTGEYLPRFHYLTWRAFEALGVRPQAGQLPVWPA